MPYLIMQLIRMSIQKILHSPCVKGLLSKINVFSHSRPMLHENSMVCSHTMLENLKDALKHNVFASFTPTLKCLHVPNVPIRKN
jgi:hypothetical protein